MEKLGIQPFYLIAQIVNFLVLFVILKKYLYQPILKVLDERKNKIKEGLENTERINQEMQKLDEKKAQEIERTKKEAQEIIEEAKKSAQELKMEIANQAQEEAAKIKKQSLLSFEEEKKKMMEEFKTQTAWLILSTTKQVLRQSLDQQKQRELIKSVLEDMKTKTK